MNEHMESPSPSASQSTSSGYSSRRPTGAAVVDGGDSCHREIYTQASNAYTGTWSSLLFIFILTELVIFAFSFGVCRSGMCSCNGHTTMNIYPCVYVSTYARSSASTRNTSMLSYMHTCFFASMLLTTGIRVKCALDSIAGLIARTRHRL